MKSFVFLAFFLSNLQLLGQSERKVGGFDSTVAVKKIVSLINSDGYIPFELHDSMIGKQFKISFLDSRFYRCHFVKVEYRTLITLKRIIARKMNLFLATDASTDNLFNDLNLDSLVGLDYLNQNKIVGQCNYLIAYDEMSNDYYLLKGFKRNDTKIFVDFYLGQQPESVYMFDKSYNARSFRDYDSFILDNVIVPEIDLKKQYYSKNENCSCWVRDKIVEKYFPFKFRYNPKRLLKKYDFTIDILELLPYSLK